MSCDGKAPTLTEAVSFTPPKEAPQLQVIGYDISLPYHFFGGIVSAVVLKAVSCRTTGWWYLNFSGIDLGDYCQYLIPRYVLRYVHTDLLYVREYWNVHNPTLGKGTPKGMLGIVLRSWRIVNSLPCLLGGCC